MTFDASCETYLFAGGGTGGHLYPGLAVAAELQTLRPQAKIIFACSDRAIDRKILDPLPYGIVPQAVRPIPRRLTECWSFLKAWRRSTAQAAAMVRDLEPAAVLGLGGFAAAPVLRQAARRSVPAAMLNPDAVPGKANQYLAGLAQAIFTQFDSTAECFPAAQRAKVQAVGCPIRGGIASADQAEAMAKLGLLAGRKTLLVLGGSLGAASVNQAIEHLSADLAALADTWQMLHITGPAAGGDLAAMAAPAGMHVRRIEYCHEMPLAYAAADLALCRGGAVTVAELTATATPAIIMPYPYHRDQQQKLNALGLEKAGAARVCDDAIDGATNAGRLREILLPLMRDAGQLKAMHDAAAGAGKIDAAAVVAKWLLQHARRSMMSATI